MALVGVELETLVSESDALTTRPPPCAIFIFLGFRNSFFHIQTLKNVSFTQQINVFALQL